MPDPIQGAASQTAIDFQLIRKELQAMRENQCRDQLPGLSSRDMDSAGSYTNKANSVEQLLIHYENVGPTLEDPTLRYYDNPFMELSFYFESAFAKNNFRRAVEGAIQAAQFQLSYLGATRNLFHTLGKWGEGALSLGVYRFISPGHFGDEELTRLGASITAYFKKNGVPLKPQDVTVTRQTRELEGDYLYEVSFLKNSLCQST
jgi:hypothetical protein